MKNTKKGMILVSTLIIMFLVIAVLLALQQHLLINRYEQQNHNFSFLEQIMLDNEIRMNEEGLQLPQFQEIELKHSRLKVQREIYLPNEIPLPISKALEERIVLNELLPGTDRVLIVGLSMHNRHAVHAIFYRNYPEQILWIERLPSGTFFDLE